MEESLLWCRYQGQEGVEQGLALALRMCAFNSTHSKRAKGRVRRERKEKKFSE